MSDLDERLRNALRDFDARVAVSVRSGFEPSLPQQRTMHTRRIRVLAPVFAAVAVLVVLIGTGVLGHQQNRAAPATPTPATTPSQTESDAARDGVYPQVAALPLEQRLGQPAQNTEGRVMDDGVWVVAHPDLPSASFSDGECLPAAGTTRSYPVCADSGYSELLLLNREMTQVERAWPMAGEVTSLFFTGDSAYCVHHGDETRMRASVCRIDKKTGQLTGIVFDCAKKVEDCSFDPSSRPTGWPGTWTDGPSLEGASRVDSSVDGEHLLVYDSGEKQVATLDRLTLEYLSP